ncbi:MAG TPA: sulfate ABC transporter permease subunit CysW [Verrucomicrobiae bacterium]|nr:sulfate ABC transporter permease subunit CysW [Verrucomicrobiae bacterium]
MAATPKNNALGDTAKSQRASDDSPLAKWLLIGTALAFVTLFLLLPLLNVFYQALAKGLAFYKESLVDPDSISAIKLTLLIAGISVPLNILFGLAASWAIAKFEFTGKAFLITLIDLPFAVSPVVAGLMFVVLFGRQGFFGSWLDAHEIKIIFAAPGMVLATIFVTFPFVARELIPVMQATGSEQEQAALTLGASGWKIFWHVTLPSVKWGLIYGVILCNARAMGEFGAVSVVSGHITGETDTLPLRVEKLYHGATGASAVAAFSVASLLALLALVTLVLKTLLEWKTERDYARAQKAIEPSAESDTIILAKSLQ